MNYDNCGSVRAYTMVEVTDLDGFTVMRRVRLGAKYCVEYTRAKELAMQARKNNPEKGCIITYTEEL